MNDFVNLYHGTSTKRSEKILKKGLILKDADSVYADNKLWPTTPGYVYVTDKITWAIYYGNKTAALDTSNEMHGNLFDVAIFSIKVPKKILEFDHDELNVSGHWPDVQEQFRLIGNRKSIDSILNILNSARIKKDLTLGVEVIKYVSLPSTNISNQQHKLYGHVKKIVSDTNEKAPYLKEFLNEVEWIRC